MHLTERRRGRRFELELAKAALPVGAELARHAPAHEGRPHRRRLGLQAHQLGDVLGGQRARHGREQLRHLDHGPAQAAQRVGQLARERRAVAAAAQIALAGKARHEAAEHGRDPGITGEAARQVGWCSASTWSRRPWRWLGKEIGRARAISARTFAQPCPAWSQTSTAERVASERMLDRRTAVALSASPAW